MIITEETTIETTKTIELEESETEILIIETESKGISYLLTMVCCHNTIPSFEPLFTPPTASFGDVGIYPVLNIGSVYLQNPYAIPHFNDPSATYLTVQNVSPTLGTSVTKTP